MSDIVISGYYGLGNSGDEALLNSIVKDLKSINPNITITALSGNAGLTKKLYGIKTVNRFNIVSVIKELRKAKMLLSGGGTLIQDATSTKSLLYYLGIIALAKKMGLKVMIYANGMGPIKDSNVKHVESVLNKVDLITLRENESLEEIERCNITVPEVIVTADPAFNMQASEKERAEEILAEYGIGIQDKIIAVSVRECAGTTDSFEEEMAKALDSISDMGYIPVFIPMQLRADLDISLRIAGKMHSQSRVIDCELAVSDMLAVIGQCSIVCGMRLHMLIFASVMNIPMAGIAYDPKIKGFMDYMNQSAYTGLEEFSGSEFSALAEKCIKNADELKIQLEKESVGLREKARENAKLAINLLEK